MIPESIYLHSPEQLCFFDDMDYLFFEESGMYDFNKDSDDVLLFLFGA